ncbi:uncharacterized protein A4U43_C01F34920 [Asparagus officinalis]|uniref:Uncharacterized protein n=1 Tax=Asparagus officinalis TaxID=4686 RepID=A0A5P1FVB5_ASPOF|nr:uncharacterized protein A4U43_C01F34920 [Asparagus officinalis]
MLDQESQNKQRQLVFKSQHIHINPSNHVRAQRCVFPNHCVQKEAPVKYHQLQKPLPVPPLFIKLDVRALDALQVRPHGFSDLSQTLIGFIEKSNFDLRFLPVGTVGRDSRELEEEMGKLLLPPPFSSSTFNLDFDLEEERRRRGGEIRFGEIRFGSTAAASFRDRWRR